jgi:hypothetical protein
MKYVKLFEDFINEEDPLAALTGGGEEKPKEDPLEKKKKEQMAKDKAAAKKHEKMVDKKEDSAEDLLKEMPDVQEKLGDKILDAIKDQDRVKIHNAILDLTYMQQDYQSDGMEAKIAKISRLKKVLDTLDKSFTSDKRM